MAAQNVGGDDLGSLLGKIQDVNALTSGGGLTSNLVIQLTSPDDQASDTSGNLKGALQPPIPDGGPLLMGPDPLPPPSVSPKVVQAQPQGVSQLPAPQLYVATGSTTESDPADGVSVISTDMDDNAVNEGGDGLFTPPSGQSSLGVPDSDNESEDDSDTAGNQDGSGSDVSDVDDMGVHLGEYILSDGKREIEHNVNSLNLFRAMWLMAPNDVLDCVQQMGSAFPATCLVPLKNMRYNLDYIMAVINYSPQLDENDPDHGVEDFASVTEHIDAVRNPLNIQYALEEMKRVKEKKAKQRAKSSKGHKEAQAIAKAASSQPPLEAPAHTPDQPYFPQTSDQLLANGGLPTIPEDQPPAPGKNLPQKTGFSFGSSSFQLGSGSTTTNLSWSQMGAMPKNTTTGSSGGPSSSGDAKAQNTGSCGLYGPGQKQGIPQKFSSKASPAPAPQPSKPDDETAAYRKDIVDMLKDAATVKFQVVLQEELDAMSEGPREVYQSELSALDEAIKMLNVYRVEDGLPVLERRKVLQQAFTTQQAAIKKGISAAAKKTGPPPSSDVHGATAPGPAPKAAASVPTSDIAAIMNVLTVLNDKVNHLLDRSYEQEVCLRSEAYINTPGFSKMLTPDVSLKKSDKKGIFRVEITGGTFDLIAKHGSSMTRAYIDSLGNVGSGYTQDNKALVTELTRAGLNRFLDTYLTFFNMLATIVTNEEFQTTATSSLEKLCRLAAGTSELSSMTLSQLREMNSSGGSGQSNDLREPMTKLITEVVACHNTTKIVMNKLSTIEANSRVKVSHEEIGVEKGKVGSGLHPSTHFDSEKYNMHTPEELEKMDIMREEIAMCESRKSHLNALSRTKISTDDMREILKDQARVNLNIRKLEQELTNMRSLSENRARIHQGEYRTDRTWSRDAGAQEEPEVDPFSDDDEDDLNFDLKYASRESSSEVSSQAQNENGAARQGRRRANDNYSVGLLGMKELKTPSFGQFK